MVTVAVRAPAAFAEAATVTVPLPVPADAPVIVSQLGSLLFAVHVHQLFVVTAIVALPPPLPIVWLVGEMLNVQAAPAWFAVNVCPAIVAVADRAPALLGAALSVTVPLPVPDAPLVTVNHPVVSLLVAVHEHQLPAVTATVAVSPPVARSWLVGEIE